MERWTQALALLLTKWTFIPVPSSFLRTHFWEIQFHRNLIIAQLIDWHTNHFIRSLSVNVYAYTVRVYIEYIYTIFVHFMFDGSVFFGEEERKKKKIQRQQRMKKNTEQINAELVWIQFLSNHQSQCDWARGLLLYCTIYRPIWQALISKWRKNKTDEYRCSTGHLEV